MNAIMAICHFCEAHGPRTLFCTQAFKYSDLINNSNSTPVSNSQPASATNSPDNISTCKACRAFESNFHHYISYDTATTITKVYEETQPPLLNQNFPPTTHNNNNNNNSTNNSTNNNICYISQSKPRDSEVYAIVRNACIRTLHCEVFEDPIYFDDIKSGSVIGYEFHIKDSEARGYQRSYSLVIIMKDRIYLQHLWSFLSKQLAIIAEEIKAQALSTFEREMKAKVSNQQQNQLQYRSRFNYSPVMPSRSNNSIGKNKDSGDRSLTELTSDSLIFGKLHMRFTWILRMSTCQISEEFVHGPMSEDWQVRMEREKDMNEFLKEANEEKAASDGCVSEELSSERLESFDDLETANDVCLNRFRVSTIRQLIQLIGKETFHKVAYNTIIGNQVIVQGKHERLVSSIIRVLEELIPLGCCQTIYYSVDYIKSYQCKLLGLSEKNTFPEEQENNGTNIFGDLNEFIFLKISFNPKQLMTDLSPTAYIDDFTSAMNRKDFNSALKKITDNNVLDFKILTNVIEYNQVPTVLVKIESYILNEKLEEKSVNSLVKLLKEEWLNKAKVFYKFLRSPQVQNSNDTDMVLAMLNLEKKDELALKYWQAGLSNECKSQIRQIVL